MRRSVSTSVVASVAAFVLAGTASATTQDTYSSKQWGLAKVGAEQAWGVTDGTGATVAVVDTGVDLSHPDLSANIISLQDADMVEPSGTCSGKRGAKTCTQDGAQDKNGHGTHVAGIIGAVANNGTGIAGVAPGSKMLPVRVLDAEGSGTADQVASGIRYAADHGADVINLSLGFLSGLDKVVLITGGLDVVYQAVDYAWAKGAVIVIAAGNDTFPLCAEPSAHPKAVCVGATDRNDLRSWYSNNDATMTGTYVVAPGGGGTTCAEDIFSTYLRSVSSVCSKEAGYEGASGTSMATPHVAGIAGLLSAKGLSNQAIVDCLIRTTDDLGTPGRDAIYGYGRVNAAKAVTSC